MFSFIIRTTILLIICYDNNSFCFGFSFITNNNNYHVSSSSLSSSSLLTRQQQQERVFTSDDVFLRCRNQHGIVESSNNNNGLLGSTSTRLSAETSKEANGETQDSSSSTTSATTTTTEVPSSLTETNSEKEEEVDDEEEEDEWEYEEYTMLTEEDFYGSEWKTGTVWNNNRNTNKVDETWVRLITKDSKLIAYWGDGAEGKWSFDTSTQFFSVSKESFGGWNGKKIWAGTIDDYYYMSGTVRGWSVLLPASVLGQWQFKRLGVTDDERGIAPWFTTTNQQDDEEESEVVDEETDE